MNDQEEMLRYGLDRVGDQVRPVDLDRRTVQTARTIHRRHIAIRAAAGLVVVALSLSIATALWDNVGGHGRTTPVDTPTRPAPRSDPDAPWMSAEDVAALTGIPQWYEISAREKPIGCGTGTSGTEIVSTLVDSATYQAEAIGPGADTVTYLAFRFYTPKVARDVYEQLDREIELCSPDDGGQGLASQSSVQTSTGVRWRESLASWGHGGAVSSLIVLRDRYLTIASWQSDGPRDFGSHDEDRASVFADYLVSGSIRHERGNPLPEWALSWTAELGPDRLGGVRLGMTEAEALATGELRRLPGSETCTTAEFRADYAGAFISHRHGVVVIDAGPNVVTAEGLGRGTTLAEFKRMYPNFREDRPYRFSAPVPGNPDARYVIDVSRLEGEPLKVDDLMLVSSVQKDSCLNQRLG